MNKNKIRIKKDIIDCIIVNFLLVLKINFEKFYFFIFVVITQTYNIIVWKFLNNFIFQYKYSNYIYNDNKKGVTFIIMNQYF